MNACCLMPPAMLFTPAVFATTGNCHLSLSSRDALQMAQLVDRVFIFPMYGFDFHHGGSTAVNSPCTTQGRAKRVGGERE